MKAIFVDSLIMKHTVELFKDAVQSALLKCRPDGIYMQAMDSSHISMVSFQFKSDMFKLYECTNAVDMGIDITQLYKILKVVSNDDMFGLELVKDHILSIQIKNTKRDKEWFFEMKLMDIDSEELDIPPQPDGWRALVNTSDFLSNVSTMSEIGDDIEIGCSGGKLCLRSCGEMTSALVANSLPCEWHGNQEDMGDVILKFTTKMIRMYGSGRRISETFEIILSPEHPIMIRYNITENSSIVIFVAPKISDDGD